jgi:quercetin dioxygenase-like cupin family protein
MAGTGEVIENPSTGEEFTVRSSTPELLESVITIKAGAPGPPGHVHPVIQERIKIVSGSLKIDILGQNRTLSAGDELVIEPGQPHRLWNEGAEDASFEAEMAPALRMQTFIETIFGLARDGKISSAGRPNLLQAAVLMQEYASEVRLTGIPMLVQTIAFGVLAPIGKLFGYRARYKKYSGES